jgi:hypothetical protein
MLCLTTVAAIYLRSADGHSHNGDAQLSRVLGTALNAISYDTNIIAVL